MDAVRSRSQRRKKDMKPPEVDEPEVAFRSQVHHWPAGTEALTAATCWPQPAQVVLPQDEQVTGRHMGISPSGGVGTPP
ncbi:hypothetical protein SDC9_90744 [bioreactor metagenome]|uniref:Uncharacterized protein n=1 Tax=bioreactor metagenome TaxID=1076179 RepID=A0A644ZTJ4_9ZZZZ